MLTRKAKYALRALVVLARTPGQPAPAHRIAREARVPEKFLETILVELRQGGYVESRRGLQGIWSSSPIFANDMGAVRWQ